MGTTKKFKPPLNFRPRQKIIREFPLNLICVYFKGKSLFFFKGKSLLFFSKICVYFKGKSLLCFSQRSTFRLIFEKCRPSSVILKIVGATLQLDQNIIPQDIRPDNFSFIYKYI